MGFGGGLCGPDRSWFGYGFLGRQNALATKRIRYPHPGVRSVKFLVFGTVLFALWPIFANSVGMNRLAQEKSPYLLQHQDNPVEWLPWGEEAFSRARLENKPIFLSIGYSTCHWCHVMAHESFEDPAIARLMNELFINVKVDREERPDVDRLYMAFVQATTGSGGWPMSVWLTPEGQPFFGGTYFPPEDRYGRPGFPTVLQRIAEVWNKDEAGIRARGAEVIAALRETTPQTENTLPDVSALAMAAGYFQKVYDPVWGGFGEAPKFPRPSVFNFLLRHSALGHGLEGQKMTLFTLQKMAEGGINDQLGGGFHRYSVDAFWHVPHFEKMLYDQAQLAIAYVEAFQITADRSFSSVAEDILDYVQRDLTQADGGFFSAEDADSLFAHGKPEHGEGAFYIWKSEEIAGVLAENEARAFAHIYGVEAGGNVLPESDPHGEFQGQNILIQRRPIAVEEADAVADWKQRLFHYREQRRPRPHRDDKVLTAWNGLMISAFAKAGAVLQRPDYLDAARAAVAFVKQHLYAEPLLYRTWREERGRVEGFAEDYAFFIQGLLDLYEATFSWELIEWAKALQAVQDQIFWDEAAGAYFSNKAGDPYVLVRLKDDYDGAEPSANSVSALNLLRLARMTHEADYSDRATKLLISMAPAIQRMPHTMPQMLVAWQLHQTPARQLVIAGSPRHADTQALLNVVRSEFLPDLVVLLADPEATNLPDWLQAMRPVQGRAAAYLCQDFACQSPITDPAELAAWIGKKR